MSDRRELIASFEGRVWGGEMHKGGYIHVPQKEAEAILELLKGQEPVAPVLVPTGYGAGIVYNCGACGTELVVLNGTNVQGVPSVVRFCRMCGKAVKWDA